MVVARAKGSAATTAEYRGDGGGGDADNSKGNSGKNGERGSNRGGGASHLCLNFFWGGSQHSHEVCFLIDT